MTFCVFCAQPATTQASKIESLSCTLLSHSQCPFATLPLGVVSGATPAATHRTASSQQVRAFITCVHASRLGLPLDAVPGHFVSRSSSFSRDLDCGGAPSLMGRRAQALTQAAAMPLAMPHR
jgi:hypothetical protein